MTILYTLMITLLVLPLAFSQQPEKHMLIAKDPAKQKAEIRQPPTDR